MDKQTIREIEREHKANIEAVIRSGDRLREAKAAADDDGDYGPDVMGETDR